MLPKEFFGLESKIDNFKRVVRSDNLLYNFDRDEIIENLELRKRLNDEKPPENVLRPGGKPLPIFGSLEEKIKVKTYWFPLMQKYAQWKTFQNKQRAVKDYENASANDQITLTTLGKDPLYSIGMKLDLDSLSRLCQTNTKMNRLLCNNHEFWKMKTFKDFPINEKKPLNLTWKSYYKRLVLNPETPYVTREEMLSDDFYMVSEITGGSGAGFSLVVIDNQGVNVYKRLSYSNIDLKTDSEDSDTSEDEYDDLKFHTIPSLTITEFEGYWRRPQSVLIKINPYKYAHIELNAYIFTTEDEIYDYYQELSTNNSMSIGIFVGTKNIYDSYFHLYKPRSQMLHPIKFENLHKLSLEFSAIFNDDLSKYTYVGPKFGYPIDIIKTIKL